MRLPYREGHYWRDISPGWECRLYGEAVDGKGDLGFNTCDEIIRDNDTSPWAYDALYACQDLLLTGERWPWSMNQAIDAKTRLGWRWSQLLHRLGKPTKKFRFRGQLTRDPYIAFYAACMVLDRPELIGDTPPVWYIYRPNFWAWRKYLMTCEYKYLRRYLFWDSFSTSNKDFVLRLRELRSIAICKR